jgi:SAM-dependent methyltransferase
MAPEFDRANFDLITASLVVFFLPDPVGALRAWRKVLVDGGRVGVSTFGPFSESWRAVNGVFRPYMPAATLASAVAFGSDAAVESLLVQSGLANPRTASRVLAVRFESKEHWHEWSWSQGTRGMWEIVPASQRPAVLEQAFDALEGCRDEQGRIGYDQAIRLTIARVN